MRPVNQQLACSIGRALGRSATDERQIRAMAAAAFHKSDGELVFLRASEIKNDIIREAVQQEGERQYGKRDAK